MKLNLHAPARGVPTPPHVEPTGPEIDNTNREYDPGPGVEVDTAAPEMAWLAALLDRMNRQDDELREFMRRPQPVWVRPSDTVTTPTGSLLVAALAPVRIMQYQANRVRVTIQNTSTTGTLVIVPEDHGPVSGGFQCLPGGGISLDTRAALSAYCTTADTTWSAVLEFVDLGAGLV